MKKIIAFLFILAFALPLPAQDKKTADKFYMLDENFKGTTQEKAVFFIRVAKQQDSCWQFDTYNLYGPMISSEQYKDEKGLLANGHFSYYNKKGTMDSSGGFANGLQDGSWYFTNDTGRAYLQKDYRAGQLMATRDLIKADSLERLKEDSLKNRPQRVEIESDFPGGVSKWVAYLSKNMVYPDRTLKSNIQGKVVIQFIVDKEGHVISPEIAQSLEYAADQEALRLIVKSPSWIPAMQDGKKVKSYKKQPITFRFQ